MVHDMFPNRTCSVLVYQPNATLDLTSKTKVSLDEGLTDIRLALDDATLQSQSRLMVISSAKSSDQHDIYQVDGQPTLLCMAPITPIIYLNVNMTKMIIIVNMTKNNLY